jgi:PKD repeat protein
MQDQNGPNGDDELPPAAPDDATGIFISIHQYTDAMLWPYEFAPGSAPNDAQLRTIGRKFAYYNGYDPIGFFYTADGTTDNWTYGKFGIASIVYEVGPSEGVCGGFFFDYDCLDGTGGAPRSFWAENVPTFVYAHKIARTPYMTSYGPDTDNVVVAPDPVQGGMPVQLTATIADHRYGADPLQPIHGAEYFVDQPGDDGTGIAMVPSDGSWGALSEEVEATLDTSGLAPGLHYILVHGLNDDGDWGPFTAVLLTVEPTQCDPVADVSFAWQPVTPTVGTVVTLTAEATGTLPITFTWDLGDGAIGGGPLLTHTYSLSGTYTVVLTATNECGEEVVQRVLTVTDGPSQAYQVYLPIALRDVLEGSTGGASR